MGSDEHRARFGFEHGARAGFEYRARKRATCATATDACPAMSKYENCRWLHNT